MSPPEVRLRAAVAVVLLGVVGVAVRPSDNQRNSAASRRAAAAMGHMGVKRMGLAQEKSRVKAYRPDRFEEDYSHLQVSPSTHRVLLRHDKDHPHKHDEAPILTVTFRLNAPVQELSLVLPGGYMLDRRHEQLEAENCNFLVGWTPEQPFAGSDYRLEKGALPLNDSHIVKCEVEEEGQTHIRIRLQAGVLGLSAEFGHDNASEYEPGRVYASSPEGKGLPSSNELEPSLAGSSSGTRRSERSQNTDEREATLEGDLSVLEPKADSLEGDLSVLEPKGGRRSQHSQDIDELEPSLAGSSSGTRRSERSQKTDELEATLEGDLSVIAPKNQEHSAQRRHHHQGAALLQVAGGQVAQARRGLYTRPFWYLLIRAWYPEATPPSETNIFALHWRPKRGDGWAGSLTFGAWPLLGDWDCVYSDWEGHGTCSVRCGGGTMMLRRRILLAPPSDGKGSPCSRHLEMEGACNEHPCLDKCWQTGVLHTIDYPMQCTAKCGGGLTVERRKWHGFGCPLITDMDAVRLSTCNEHQCETPCRHSSAWVPVTECSQLCGKGHFWMIQEVVQKDRDDHTCQPKWRQQACMRQECRPFLVIHPDRNLMPYVNQEYRVAIVFEVQSVASAPNEAKEIVLQAPRGYSFGPEGQKCQIYEHNLLPYFTGCTVGDKMRGSNEAVLSLLTKMPSNVSHGAPIHYRFMIDVVNADCNNDDWSVDASLNNIYCKPKGQDNEWLIDFGGTAKWKASGYQMYLPVTVAADNFHYQDQWGCSGQIRLVKGEDNLCVDVTGKKYDKGSPVHVSACPAARPDHGEEETTSWIAPPTGAGPIRLRFHFERCACIHLDEDQKDGDEHSLKVGMLIKLDDCSGDVSERCQWIMPSSTFGSVRSGLNPRYCIGHAEEEDDDGIQNLELVLCRKKHVKWLTPCPGVARGKNPHQLAGSGGLTLKERPDFCYQLDSECPNNMFCNERDGICVPLTDEGGEEEEEEE